MGGFGHPKRPKYFFLNKTKKKIEGVASHPIGGGRPPPTTHFLSSPMAKPILCTNFILVLGDGWTTPKGLGAAEATPTQDWGGRPPPMRWSSTPSIFVFLLNFILALGVARPPP